MTVYGLLLIASLFALALVPTAHVYAASKYGIVLMQGHDGLFARQLQSLLRALRTWTFEGFADAGSTGLPSFGLLSNRGEELFLS